MRFLPFIYAPQRLKLSEAPASNCVPAVPTLCTVNEIRLISPLPVGNDGVAPDGNKKYVLNPTVAVPELTILTVCDSPSVPPVARNSYSSSASYLMILCIAVRSSNTV